MTQTPDLIAQLTTQLSAPAASSRKTRTPSYWGRWLLVILGAYALGAQAALGFRPDLAAQLSRPLYISEILLLALLLFSSGAASVLAMYPDAYQKPKLLKLPYGLFFMLLCLVAFQLLLPLDARMVMPGPHAHGMECAVCIASVALLPAALLFAIMRKGASVRQWQSGAVAVLAASAIGCLTLRLAEMNDSLLHLAAWHYLPTLLFATLGALAGKAFLKW
jgi:hypothetical protein